MILTCLDLEGVLIPEIWINLAEKMGIEELKLTTRDIPDYDDLMQYRIGICNKHQIRLDDIHEVVQKLDPLDGAVEFLSWLREESEVVILSDTFSEFAKPMISKLNHQFDRTTMNVYTVLELIRDCTGHEETLVK